MSVSVLARGGEVLQSFAKEHTDRVCTVAMDGDTIATGVRMRSSNQEAHRYNSRTLHATATALPLTHGFNLLGAPYGRQSRDRTIRLWSRASTSCTATLSGCDEVPLCLSLRGGLLLSGENTHRKIAKARLWSIGDSDGGGAGGAGAETDTSGDGDSSQTSPRVLCVYAEHTEPIWSVSLGAEYALSASHDTSARVWPIRVSEVRADSHAPSTLLSRSTSPRLLSASGMSTLPALTKCSFHVRACACACMLVYAAGRPYAGQDAQLQRARAPRARRERQRRRRVGSHRLRRRQGKDLVARELYDAAYA